MADKTKLYIKLPEGFEVPEDLEDGGSFEAVVEIRKEDGKYCLKTLDGMELSPEKYEEEPEEKTESFGRKVSRASMAVEPEEEE